MTQLGELYVIRFDFPGGAPVVYAGLHKGAFGWAPSLETAETYESAEAAQRVLENGYGENAAAYGRVMTVKEARDAEGS